MGITDPTENDNDECSNSRELTGQLTNSTKQQEHRSTLSDENIKSCKPSIKKKRKDKHLNLLTSLREQMSSKYKRLNDIAQKQGSSSWLTVLPIKQLRFSFSKAEFWDAVYLRYRLPLKRLPSHCGYSKVYTVQYALLCKRRGFATLRQNELRGNIAEMLQKVTNDVRIEPILQPLAGEEQSVGENESAEARADISARGFWCRGQGAFLAERIFYPNAQRHENETLKRCHELDKHEKKRDYSSRILNVEQGLFTPLVFSIAGGVGRKCPMFVK